MSRLLLYLLLALLATKLFLRLRFKELLRRLDRVVNATLIAIAIVYSFELGLWLLSGRH